MLLLTQAILRTILSFEKKVAYGNFFAVDTYIENCASLLSASFP